MGTITCKDSDVYYSSKYWNDYPPVLEYMCENYTGDKKKWWTQDFLERYASQQFERGLFLNCGNGWVERDFIDKGIVKHAVGFDFSHKLLLDAQNKRENRRIDYFLTDANRVDFAENQFDLVVNAAALHHVQYINRLSQILCKTLQPDGIFVNADYIGPHRNQYSLIHWFILQRVNRALPENIRRNPFNRPHLPTMLFSDPTEAIHSELLFEMVARYFNIVERHDTGGGIAYEIMTHNQNMQALSNDELAPYIAYLLDLDRKYTRRKIVPPLFSYFIARPRKDVLQDTGLLERYQDIEAQREARAARRSGVYSFRDYINLKVLSSPRTFIPRFTRRLMRSISSALKI